MKMKKKKEKQKSQRKIIPIKKIKKKKKTKERQEEKQDEMKSTEEEGEEEEEDQVKNDDDETAKEMKKSNAGLGCPWTASEVEHFSDLITKHDHNWTTIAALMNEAFPDRAMPFLNKTVQGRFYRGGATDGRHRGGWMEHEEKAFMELVQKEIDSGLQVIHSICKKVTPLLNEMFPNRERQFTVESTQSKHRKYRRS